MSGGIGSFYEKVYKRNLKENPSNSMQQKQMQRFLADSWKYLTTTTDPTTPNSPNTPTMQEEPKASNFIPKPRSNDIKLLRRIKQMSRRENKKCPKSTTGSQHNKLLFNNESETNFDRRLWLANNKSILNALLLQTNTGKENLLDYPNNFHTQNRPFQRPFRPI